MSKTFKRWWVAVTYRFNFTIDQDGDEYLLSFTHSQTYVIVRRQGLIAMRDLLNTVLEDSNATR